MEWVESCLTICLSSKFSGEDNGFLPIFPGDPEAADPMVREPRCGWSSVCTLITWGPLRPLSLSSFPVSNLIAANVE